MKIKNCKDITLDNIAKIQVNGDHIYKYHPNTARNKPNSPAWLRQQYIEKQKLK